MFNYPKALAVTYCLALLGLILLGYYGVKIRNEYEDKLWAKDQQIHTKDSTIRIQGWIIVQLKDKVKVLSESQNWYPLKLEPKGTLRFIDTTVMRYGGFAPDPNPDTIKIHY